MADKITGYRELSPEEISIVNDIKREGVRIGRLVKRLQHDTTGLDQRWISVGATDLQKGLRGLIRGVAQPTTF